MSFEITGERQYKHCPEENTLEIFLPMKLIRRGGKTHMVTGDDQLVDLAPANNDTALVRALAQAHIWLQELENGQHNDVLDLSRKVNKQSTYVSRILRLTTLSPQLQEAVLFGQNLGGRSLTDFMAGVSSEWFEQKQWLLAD